MERRRAGSRTSVRIATAHDLAALRFCQDSRDLRGLASNEDARSRDGHDAKELAGDDDPFQTFAD